MTRCVAHRGTPGGMIPENTAESARVAMLSGAEVVEVDVSVTTDGAVLAFHDGTEQRMLGTARSITAMGAAEVAAHPILNGQLGDARVCVQSLAHVVGSLRGTGLGVHVDRAWPWWPQVLPVLDALGMSEQILVKMPGTPEAMDHAAAHRPSFGVVAICRDRAMVESALDHPLDVRVIELCAERDDSDVLDPVVIEAVHARGLEVLVNAEVVWPPLWRHEDDEVSVLVGPEQGWGRLLDAGVDLVQTDFPWLFTQFRDAR